MEAHMTSRIAYLVAASLSLTACASAGSYSSQHGQSSLIRANVLTATDISASGATTAYEALQRLRPVFLVSKVDLAPLSERKVYLNGIPLGGIGELRLIPANAVQEIRFVHATEGG